ncbi:Protein CBR-MAT-1 [Caenorhabditis briggsae]|uniref:Cell division cycle protein 27 homolog n=1 Tax=Caenorhabditis briggsae TaxID=6238 RepID=A8XBW2_CAEBR|nr:Protein CBR-MAT-1 [Caenorhabditis briggsae]CAP30128.3 Protein CBR-MAT-1 [Caenorhabditis briggsae]
MNSAGSGPVTPQLREMIVRCSSDKKRTIAQEITEMMTYYAFDDAIFLAELYYETQTDPDNLEEALFLYADCLYRANKKEECYGLLRSADLSGAKLHYLFARVAFDLSKNDECRGALFEHDNGIIREAILEDSRVAAHANFLHAQLLCDENHMDLAVESCEKALDENIFLWTAIITYLRFGGENLSATFDKHSDKTNGSEVTSPSAVMKSATPSSTSAGPSVSSIATRGRIPSTNPTPEAGNSSRGPSTRRTTRSSVPSVDRELRYLPATTSSRQTTTPVTTSGRTRPVAPRKSSRISEMSSRRSDSSATTASTAAACRAALFTQPERPHTRATHSSRNRSNAALNSDTENSNAVNTRSRDTGGSRGSASSQRVASTGSDRLSDDGLSQMNAPMSSVASSLNNDDLGDAVEVSYDDRYKWLFDLYRHISFIEECISTYNWKTADALFAKLDKEILLNTSMIRLQLGRACFEQSEYRECRVILSDLHERKKWKVEGTELLSTSMWHLQDTHALSALAQTLTTESRERAQSWCVAGNCFSLQRQHTQAIECMERAIQLDKRFAYAYTLLGHELIVQDDLDKASGSFRSALLLSPRDYRAWYGLGLVHLKKEQNTIALTNIQKAVSINPTNRAMLSQRGKTDTALVLIDRALTLNPLDVACRFNRARLLFESKRNDECLKELEKLKASSPDEAFIYHLLARVHRRMGNTHLALLSYSWAAELDPRGEQNPTDTNHVTREEYEDDEYGSPV